VFSRSQLVAGGLRCLNCRAAGALRVRRRFGYREMPPPPVVAWWSSNLWNTWLASGPAELNRLAATGSAGRFCPSGSTARREHPVQLADRGVLVADAAPNGPNGSC
jgi:hypothetical protein